MVKKLINILFLVSLLLTSLKCLNISTRVNSKIAKDKGKTIICSESVKTDCRESIQLDMMNYSVVSLDDDEE